MKNFKRRILIFAGLVVSAALIAACGSSPKPDSMAPGVYYSTGTGYSGAPFTVKVTVGPAYISNIEISGLADTAGLGDQAAPLLVDRILEFQTAGVDAISGATFTSNGIKAAVVEALRKAGAPAAFTRTPYNERTSVTETVEVLVIGGGAAGFSAAVTAKQANDTLPAKERGLVVLIEKLDMFGGSTKRSAGILYAPQDPGDTPALRAYYINRAQGYLNLDLLDTFLANVTDSLVFLGIQNSPPFPLGTSSVPRSRRTSEGGAGLINILIDKAETVGVDYRTGIRATRLITNNAGKVVQVKAESTNVDYTFNVRRGVVIAAGGFDSDHTGLMAQYNPNSQYDIPASSHGNTGEGIKMGIEIEAATVFKGGKIGWGIIDKSLPGDSVISGWGGDAGKLGSILIKQDGGIVSIEAPGAGTAADGTPLTAAVYETAPDYPPLQSAMVRAREAGATKFWLISTSAPNSAYEARGFAYTSIDSAADLASKIGADSDKLAASFTTRFDNIARWTVTKVEPSSIGSIGGLKINEQAQVLKVAVGSTSVPKFPGFAVIPGLWAAGESANGDFFYHEYSSGTSLSLAVTFGRIAGMGAGVFTPRIPY